MKYGSLRFSQAVSNNTNELVLADVPRPHKVVAGKDVALVLPRDPKDILPWEGYPTHQESWLPLWYVALYHSRAETAAELQYQKELSQQIAPEQKQLLRKALLEKASGFITDYNSSQEEPRKKFKKLTRLAQDVLLYLDMPEAVIRDHDAYLATSPYAELVKTANELRTGRGLEKAEGLAEALSERLREQIAAAGGEAVAQAAYQELQDRLTQRGEIFWAKEPNRDLGFYTDLVVNGYDLELGGDEHDLDVIAIRDGVDTPEFHQVQRVSESRRMDVIVVPPNLKQWDTVKGGKESFQPVSYMILTHTKPVSEAGQQLRKQLEETVEPAEAAAHYLGAAKDFFDGDGFGKSWARRREAEVPLIKKVIPLHRVARDLLPRAVYMLKNNRWPAGLSDAELFRAGETEEIATRIDHWFSSQAIDANLEEVEALAGEVEKKLLEYYRPEHSEAYQAGLEAMRQFGEHTQEPRIKPKLA